MMSAWKLPNALEVAGHQYKIRTDFRAVLDILMAMNDPDIFEPDMTDEEKELEKSLTMLQILYVDFDRIPPKDYQEAADRAVEFIDMGIKDDGKARPRTMDWKKDAPVIIPSVNRVVGKEVRSLKYMHWWTFLGAYMEIGESLFSVIHNIRQKLAEGKHLDKWEAEFYRDNKQLIDFQEESSSSSEEDDYWKRMFG